MTSTKVDDFGFSDEELRIIYEDTQKINAEDKQNYDELTNKYENTYKNILWIDDRAKQEAGSDTDEEDKIVTKPESVIKLEWMQHYLSDPDSAYHIEQVSQFKDAVELIVKNPQYDLVIFDINLVGGFKLVEGFKSTGLKDKLKSDFVQHYIAFNYDNIDKKTAGVYLYLLLLSVGYPINRMVVYTGNGLDAFKATLLGQCFDFHHPILLTKSPNQKNMDIESYFNGVQNSYYRIRRLVFQACEYWKKHYAEKEDNEIPFNKLYYRKKSDSMRQKEMFIGLLDHIEMLFPVRIPKHPEKVYYQAMQFASSFHEESADIKDIKSNNIQCYHSCVRNFRNWTAHLKLKNAKEQKLDGEQFALLFCLAMRTYFDESQVNNEKDKKDIKITDELFQYENLYGFDTEYTDTDKNQLRKLIQPIFSELMKKVNTIKKNNDIITLRDAVIEYGKLPNVVVEQQHLFFSLWFYNIEAKYNVTQCVNDAFTLSYTIDSTLLGDICEMAKKKHTDADAIFMRYCFRWLNSDT